MAVWISADWLPQNEKLYVGNFPTEVEERLEELRPDHEYIQISGGDVVIKRMFDKCMAVRDVYRYNVKTGIALKCRQDVHPSIKSDLPTIVLLLESPHRSEYDSERKPIAPAGGKTGANLDDGLDYVLSQIKSEVVDGSRIIVSNPVQFQTSLHMILPKPEKKYKDALKISVWKAVWSHQYIEGGFESRMEKYAPYLVINACTGGQEDDKGLNKQVTDFLKRKKICRKIYEIDHPFSWKIPILHPI